MKSKLASHNITGPGKPLIDEAAIDTLEDELPAYTPPEDYFKTVPDDKNVRILAQLGENFKAKSDELELVKAQLVSLEEELKQITEKDIPDKLFELGMSSFILTDGTQITTRPEVYCGITQKHQESAFSWLRNNGYGDLIKNTVSLTFGKGEDALAKVAIEEITKLGRIPEQKTSVHPQTLKAFIKELDEKGAPIPEDLFSIYRVNKARLKKG